MAYPAWVPRLWNDTIATHRQAVRDAVIDATGTLVARRGPASVTMSQIAENAGIGRATLYKYFPDVDSILTAWHERQITTHLAQLAEARDGTSGPGARLEAVLHTYARIAGQSHGHGDAELAALLHRGDHVSHAERHLQAMIQDLIRDAAQAGDVRDDIAPDELARYCLHALTAAGGLTSRAARQRLVEVTLAGLRTTPT